MWTDKDGSVGTWEYMICGQIRMVVWRLGST